MQDVSHVIVFITANKLQAGKVLVSPQMAIVDAVESEWNTTTITDLFTQLKEKYKTSVMRVVFGEDISFVGCIGVPKGKDKDRLFIQEAAQKIIPHALNRARWDYKDVFTKKDRVVIQIASLLHEPVTSVLASASKLGIIIQAMEPASYAIARITENMKEPHISVFKGESILSVASYRGLVLGTVILQDIHDYPGLRSLVRSVYEHYGLVVKTAICSHDDIVMSLRQGSSLEISKAKIHPMLGISKKKDIKGIDSEVLNIASQGSEIDSISTKVENTQNNVEKSSTPKEQSIHVIDQKNKDNESPALKENTRERSYSKTRLYIGLGLLFIISLVIFLIILGAIVKSNTATISESIPTPIILPSENPSPTTAEPIAVTPSIYKVRILNGTGLKGEAQKVRQLLEKIGFTTFDTGNADAYTYSDTVVKLKEGVSSAVFEVVKQALGNVYTPVLSKEILTSNYAYDILITTGKSK